MRYLDLKGDLADGGMGQMWPNFDPLFRAVSDPATFPGPLAHGLPREWQQDAAAVNAGVTR
jgi:hypothetical protein